MKLNDNLELSYLLKVRFLDHKNRNKSKRERERDVNESKETDKREEKYYENCL
jgi:hypothetical protein